MLLIIGLLFCLKELKDILYDKKIKVLIFFIILLLLCIILYIFKEKIPSVMTITSKIEELINGNN